MQDIGVGLHVPLGALPGLGGDHHDGDLAALPYGIVHDVHAGRQPQADSGHAPVAAQRWRAARYGSRWRRRTRAARRARPSGARWTTGRRHRSAASPRSVSPDVQVTATPVVGVRGGGHLATGAQLDVRRSARRPAAPRAGRRDGRPSTGAPCRSLSQLAERQVRERAPAAARRARRCVRARRPGGAGHRRRRAAAARAPRWDRAGCRRLPSRTGRDAPARSSAASGLRQGQRQGQPADAAACDQHRPVGGHRLRLRLRFRARARPPRPDSRPDRSRSASGGRRARTASSSRGTGSGRPPPCPDRRADDRSGGRAPMHWNSFTPT